MSGAANGGAAEPAGTGGRGPEIWVLLVSMALSAVFGVVATRSYMALHNTLENNGRWVSTKTTLERGLLGAYSFITERQALAGGALRLDAWHGYNEVSFAEDLVDTTRIELDLYLEEQAYAALFYDRRPGESYEGILLSTIRRFRNRIYEASPDGDFLAARPLATRLVESGRWLRVRLELEPGWVEVFVDDASLGRFDRPEGPRRGTFGFRSGQRPVSVDNVVVTDGAGRSRGDTFDAPAGRGRVTVGVVLLLLVANLAIYALLRRLTGSEGLTLAFSLLMVNGTLLVVAALLFFLVLMRGDRYLFAQDRLAEQEAYFRKGAADVVMGEIRERHAPRDAPRREAADSEDSYRILFIGGSQTWGAGAALEGEVFVRVLEDLLNDTESTDAGSVPHFECINGGFSAHKASDLVPLLDEMLETLHPDMVVINVSSNDKSNSRFARPLRRLVELSLAASARVVLVQEANSPETGAVGLAVRHREMAALADELDLPIIDMHGHLTELRWDGFLWWDHVHLTTFGQRLMAEKLLAELGAITDSRSGESIPAH